MRFSENKLLHKSIITALVIVLLFEVVVFVSSGYRKQANDVELYRQGYALEAEIEKVFLNVFTIAESYASFLEESPTATREETEAFLDHILDTEEDYVRNIAYLEDTTIKYNYPYEENSTSIGIDLGEVDGQKEGVLFVKDNEEAIFIGPVTLVQGGQAFIVRMPIVSEGTYVGQISTVIDADKLITTLEEEAEAVEVSMKISTRGELPMIEIGDSYDKENIMIQLSNDYITWDIYIYDNQSKFPSIVMSNAIRLLGIAAALFIANSVYIRSRLNEEVSFKAHHDSLTNDYNRQKFIEDFNSGKLKNKLIAFTDINKFKVLNDTLGHLFGDWGLKEMSRKFNKSGKFITYRNSGDEFILVSKSKMSEDEFLEYVKEFNAPVYNEQLDQNISITLSIGVIESIPDELTLKLMLIYLDYAMYDAKKAGKTYTLVDDSLMSKYSDQKEIENIIVDDIKDNNLYTHFQPIVNLKSKRIEGVEVLSRWARDGEIVLASSFIDIVKRIKQIEKLDQNLFNNLQKEYKKFTEEDIDLSDFYFAVNLSAETLKMFEHDYTKFDDFVKNNIIPKENIIFEISEDINLGIISNDTLEYINSKGFNLVIDDFGSGVSKLTDVLSGKLLAIKTDKSMMPRSKKDKKKTEAFKTILKAINASGSKVCVEGIETKEQLEIAISAGSTSVQGYLFQKAVPHQELLDYLKDFDFENYLK